MQTPAPDEDAPPFAIRRRPLSSVPRARHTPRVASGGARRATPLELREAQQLLTSLERRASPRPAPQPLPSTPASLVYRQEPCDECGSSDESDCEAGPVSPEGVERLSHEASYLLQRLRRLAAAAVDEATARGRELDSEHLQRGVVFEIRKTVLRAQSSGHGGPELAHPDAHHMLGLLALDDLVRALAGEYQRTAAARRADLVTSEAAHTKLLLLKEDCASDTARLREGAATRLSASGVVRHVEARLASLLLLETCEDIGGVYPSSPSKPQPFAGLIDGLKSRCERALRQRDDAIRLAPRCVQELRRARADLEGLRAFAMESFEDFEGLLSSAWASLGVSPGPAPGPVDDGHRHHHHRHHDGHHHHRSHHDGGSDDGHHHHRRHHGSGSDDGHHHHRHQHRRHHHGSGSDDGHHHRRHHHRRHHRRSHDGAASDSGSDDGHHHHRSHHDGGSDDGHHHHRRHHHGSGSDDGHHHHRHHHRRHHRRSHHHSLDNGHPEPEPEPEPQPRPRSEPRRQPARATPSRPQPQPEPEPEPDYFDDEEERAFELAYRVPLTESPSPPRRPPASTPAAPLMRPFAQSSPPRRRPRRPEPALVTPQLQTFSF